jgi:hypothetical protein
MISPGDSGILAGVRGLFLFQFDFTASGVLTSLASGLFEAKWLSVPDPLLCRSSLFFFVAPPPHFVSATLEGLYHTGSAKAFRANHCLGNFRTFKLRISAIYHLTRIEQIVWNKKYVVDVCITIAMPEFASSRRWRE